MALGSTQLLTEMNNRNISWGVKAAVLGLTTLPLSCADCLEIWEPQPPGTLRACPGLYRDCFTFTIESFQAQIPAGISSTLIEGFRGFTQFLQVTAGTVP
jgi:hypothetical protein